MTTKNNIVIKRGQALLFVWIAFVVLCSCKENRRKDSIATIVREWTGKEIKFPDGMACTSMGRDTTCIDVYSDNFKILLYVDSLGCTSCRQNLFDWRKLINESDTAFVRKPEFVFVFQPKKNDEDELHTILRSNGFRHPVFIDKNNEFNQINQFPSNPEYQCFLLDKDNKVVMVGNPSLIKGIWILYKKVISEKETIVSTTRKGGAFTSLHRTTTLPPHFSLIKKGGRKSTKLIC